MHGSVGNYTCNMYMGIYSKFTNNLLVIASIWLMDMFFNSVTSINKQRYHFNEFMTQVRYWSYYMYMYTLIKLRPF